LKIQKKPIFTFTFETLICQYITKGYHPIQNKCNGCKFGMFGIQEKLICLKCLYNDQMIIHDNFSKNLDKFLDGVSQSKFYVKEKLELTDSLLEEFNVIQKPSIVIFPTIFIIK